MATPSRRNGRLCLRAVMLAAVLMVMVVGPTRAAGPAAEADDGIQLLVKRGPTRHDVVLQWTGSSRTKEIFRSTDPRTLLAIENKVAEASGSSWDGGWAPGDMQFFRVTAGLTPCDEASLLAALAEANASGGGTIRLDCRTQVIPMTGGLGTIRDGVVLDGEGKSNTLEYVGDFTGCAPGDNGIGGPAVGRMRGSDSVVRGLIFRNFLESLQLDGPRNTVEGNAFVGHLCSDDAVSMTSVAAVGSVIRGNVVVDYRDKAFQLSFGGGMIQKNVFVDTQQPIRMPYDNTGGEPFYILDNWIGTRGDREACAGVQIDGVYTVEFAGNKLRCSRGLRLGGRTEILVHDNLIQGNGHVGVRVGGNAVASLWNNVITANGFVPGSLPSGGVVVWENGQADLGGGRLLLDGGWITSPGGNVLQGNGFGDARNLRGGYTLAAEGNCWDGTTMSGIAADVEGDVDYDPFLESCSP